MDESKTENIYWRFIKFVISISLSIALLELSDVDMTRVSVFSSDNFSLAIATLFVICIIAFDNMLISVAKWLKKKRKIGLSN
jgi:hypothetical protein